MGASDTSHSSHVMGPDYGSLYRGLFGLVVEAAMSWSQWYVTYLCAFSTYCSDGYTQASMRWPPTMAACGGLLGSVYKQIHPGF